MTLSGTLVGFICALALLMAAIFAAILERKEKAQGNTQKSRFLSRTALVLFLAAFVAGVAVSLVGGVRPREGDEGMMKKPMSGSGPGGSTKASIGKVDEKEMEALKKRIDKNPKDIAALNRLGHLALQNQDYEMVFNLAEQALQIDPKNSEALTHMGMSDSAMQEKEKALQEFDAALKSNPKFPEALLFKGIVQFQNQDWKGAKETWDQFMKFSNLNDPGRPRVEMFLQKVNEALAATSTPPK
ncbi:MAG: hypothetical protein HQM15_00120 [Deltaproteobacteria bacterium]|nr:hypothetical protein [Deltaproteobacteria bacterium]